MYLYTLSVVAELYYQYRFTDVYLYMLSVVAELYYQYRFTDVYLYTLSVVAELIISIDLQMCICICCQWLQNCIFDSLVARSCIISSLAARSSIISSLVARRYINNISDSCKVCERE